MADRIKTYVFSSFCFELGVINAFLQRDTSNIRRLQKKVSQVSIKY